MKSSLLILIELQGQFEETLTRRVGTGREILCIAKDSLDSRLAVGTRDRLVQVWKYTKSQLLPIFSVTLDSTVPKTVVFSDKDASILVFGLCDGNL